MFKFGFLAIDAPARILGVPIEEERMGTLLESKELVEEASDMIMDEESGVRRILERLREMEGNQSIVVTAILEVTSPSSTHHSLLFSCRL